MADAIVFMLSAGTRHVSYQCRSTWHEFYQGMATKPLELAEDLAKEISGALPAMIHKLLEAEWEACHLTVPRPADHIQLKFEVTRDDVKFEDVLGKEGDKS